MMKRAKKQRSFLEDSEMRLLEAATKNAEQKILNMTSLLERQENNLFLKQAEEVAAIEQRHILEATAHLISIYKNKLTLLDSKVQLMEIKSLLPTSCSFLDKTEAIEKEMNEIGQKLRQKDLSFLNTAQNHGEDATDKENIIANNVLQSGGSSLDGSFQQTGVTYEEIMRPKYVMDKIPQPNFDATLDFDNEKTRIDIYTPARPPPFVLPVRQTPSLGPMPTSTPRAYNPNSQIPQRPVLSSMLGQQLNRN